MKTPQQLQITIDADDEDLIRRLKLAIESELKKKWEGGTSSVVFDLPETYPTRVINRLRAECKADGWLSEYTSDQRGPDFGSLTFTAAPSSPPGIVCRCPNGIHVRGCGAVLRNPQ